jgi:hypothetical protein
MVPVITYSSGDYEIGNLIGFFPTWRLLSHQSDGLITMICMSQCRCILCSTLIFDKLVARAGYTGWAEEWRLEIYSL